MRKVLIIIFLLVCVSMIDAGWWRIDSEKIFYYSTNYSQVDELPATHIIDTLISDIRIYSFNTTFQRCPSFDRVLSKMTKSKFINNNKIENLLIWITNNYKSGPTAFTADLHNSVKILLSIYNYSKYKHLLDNFPGYLGRHNIYMIHSYNDPTYFKKLENIIISYTNKKYPEFFNIINYNKEKTLEMCCLLDAIKLSIQLYTNYLSKPVIDSLNKIAQKSQSKRLNIRINEVLEESYIVKDKKEKEKEKEKNNLWGS